MMKLEIQGVRIIFVFSGSGVGAAPSTDDGNDDGYLGKGEVYKPDFAAS